MCFCVQLLCRTGNSEALVECHLDWEAELGCQIVQLLDGHVHSSNCGHEQVRNMCLVLRSAGQWFYSTVFTGGQISGVCRNDVVLCIMRAGWFELWWMCARFHMTITLTILWMEDCTMLFQNHLAASKSVLASFRKHRLWTMVKSRF